jgi:hypothetical protein
MRVSCTILVNTLDPSSLVAFTARVKGMIIGVRRIAYRFFGRLPCGAGSKVQVEHSLSMPLPKGFHHAVSKSRGIMDFNNRF